MPYTVSDIITAANNLLDDSLTPAMLVGWINDCLAEIGTSVNAVFPEADVTNTTASLVIPSIWARQIIVPYVAAKGKQQDSSQFEYTDMFNQYTSKLNNFVSRYTPPLQYQLIEDGQAITINGVAYTTVYGDTLDALASANNIADFNSIITENTANGITLAYVSNIYEADMNTIPYLYGGDW